VILGSSLLQNRTASQSYIPGPGQLCCGGTPYGPVAEDCVFTGSIRSEPACNMQANAPGDDLPGLDPGYTKRIPGAPGKFELKIETAPSTFVTVLSNNDMADVSEPRETLPGTGNYSIIVNQTENGAKTHQSALIRYGATTDPAHHRLSGVVDREIIFTAPLSLDFAAREQKEPLLAGIGMPVGDGREGL
jgi:hypothetical protein